MMTTKYVVNESRKHALIHAPNLTNLREMLDELEACGLEPNAPLMFSQLVNALGTFSVYPIDHDCEQDDV